jgi:hypothetical protein
MSAEFWKLLRMYCHVSLWTSQFQSFAVRWLMQQQSALTAARCFAPPNATSAGKLASVPSWVFFFFSNCENVHKRRVASPSHQPPAWRIRNCSLSGPCPLDFSDFNSRLENCRELPTLLFYVHQPIEQLYVCFKFQQARILSSLQLSICSLRKIRI